MSRPLRYVPPGGALVEITVRTFQARFLLRPGPALNELIGGALGRAQRQYPVQCHAVVFLSNHFHLLLSVPDAQRMADFMECLNSKLAREVNRLHHWQGDVWAGRYRAIVVSEEEEAQVDRLRYLLSHGVKEGLVARASDWPGVHSLRETLANQPIRGYWFDRTAEYYARERGEEFDRLRYSSAETFELSPLPCWAHFAPDDYRTRVAEMVEAIESEAARQLACRDCVPLGVREVLRQHPHTRPNRAKRTPAPLFHAATQIVRRALKQAYGAFVSAYRAAAERWRAGDRSVRFPLGCFPPPLAFVAFDSSGP